MYYPDPCFSPLSQYSNRAEIVAQTMKSSYLWNYVQQLHLEENMRVKNSNDEEDKEFEKYLLDIGQGNIPTHPEIGEYMIKIPENMASKSEHLNQFIDEIFPNLAERIQEASKDRDVNPDWNQWVHQRTIICSRNDDVEAVNRLCLDKIKDQPHVYRSADKMVQSSDAKIIPTEFLNSHTPSGCPEHCIILKIGTPIILLRNMDKKNGHVKGERLVLI